MLCLLLWATNSVCGVSGAQTAAFSIKPSPALVVVRIRVVTTSGTKNGLKRFRGCKDMADTMEVAESRLDYIRIVTKTAEKTFVSKVRKIVKAARMPECLSKDCSHRSPIPRVNPMGGVKRPHGWL